MSPEEFWRIVDTSRENVGTEQAAQLLVLRRLLTPLTIEQLISFSKNYREALNRAYTWDLWAAAYIINGGCSDDGFDYFRDWLIAQGSKAYSGALTDTELLSDIVKPGEEVEFEEFRYVPYKLYQEKTGQKMPNLGIVSPSEPVGEPFEEDEDSLRQRFPLLSEKFSQS